MSRKSLKKALAGIRSTMSAKAAPCGDLTLLNDDEFYYFKFLAEKQERTGGNLTSDEMKAWTGLWARTECTPALEPFQVPSIFRQIRFLRLAGIRQVLQEEERDSCWVELAQASMGDHRRLLLEREYQEAQHEDQIYNRGAGGNEEAANLRAMIELANMAQAPERLTWWAEHLTGGARLEPEEARAWLEAYAAALEAPQAHHHHNGPRRAQELTNEP